MKFLIFFSFLVLSLRDIKAEELCLSPQGNVSYSFNVNCEDLSNCWLGFMPIEDAFYLQINNQKYIDQIKSKNYSHQDSFYVQLHNETNQVLFNFSDLNQNINTSKKFCILKGNFKKVVFENGIKWFLRTGASLYSSLFLVLTASFLLLTILYRKTFINTSLFFYCIISAIYLVSFSEYPRLYLDPILFSGGIHFPLRLLQDLSLIYVFYHLYKAYDFYNILNKIFFIYASVIGTFILMLLSGVRDYHYYQNIIIFTAPLVAAPMLIGLYLSLKSEDKVEKKFLFPFFLSLAICQLNDLMCFWGIYSGYFTVKFYIPLVVSLIILVYIRRFHMSQRAEIILREKKKTIDHFLHDLSSPLASIKVVLDDLMKTSSEKGDLAKSALKRIEDMAYELSFDVKPDINIASTPICSLIETIISQKKVEKSFNDITFSYSKEIFALTSPLDLQRYISNFLNNSIECFSGISIEVKVKQVNELVVVTIQDSGPGIDKDTLQLIRKGVRTSTKNSQGIGISSAIEGMKNFGGTLEIESTLQVGTTIQLNLIRSEVPNWYNSNISSTTKKISIPRNENLNHFITRMSTFEKGVTFIGSYYYDPTFFQYLQKNNIQISSATDVSSKEDMILETHILVEDDIYVRRAWEIRFKEMGRKIKIYPSIQAFIRDIDTIIPGSTLYIDRNVGELDSVDYLNSFSSLSFKEIILMSYDRPDHFVFSEKIKFKNNKLPPDMPYIN